MKTHLELFAGIGGIALASEWAGFTHVGFVERDPFCQKVLAKHWPEVPIYNDVTTFDGFQFRGVDLISGGFPCQPHSLAGSRKASSDERDLWGEVVRIVGEAKPRWFLGENVPGLFSSESGRFFGRVVNDLATLGYRVGWAMYGASDTRAVHRRNRVFIVGYSDQPRLEGCGKTGTVANADAAYSDSERFRQSGGVVSRACDEACRESSGSGQTAILDSATRSSSDVADATSVGREGLSRSQTGDSQYAGTAKEAGRRLCEFGREDGGDATDAESQQDRGLQLTWVQPDACGEIAANASRISNGRTDTPAGTIGIGREPRHYVGWGDRSSDWREWGISPTVRLESRVRGSHDGISNRVDQIKALGNAVVPQQIYPILKAIAEAL